jgi:hypothetical protein
MRRRAVSLLLVAGLAAGCVGEDPCRAAELTPIANPRLAIVMSDYASSAIAIIDDDGLVIAPWLHSGTRPPQLVAALSGDVVLPRVMPEAHALVLIDRYHTDVLTRVSFAEPHAITQHDLRGGRTSGTSPNPQDVIALHDGRWLVSRFNPAEDGSAPSLARGNDLAILDASRALVDRIDLGADVEVEGERYFARPSALAAMRDGLVLVGLARLSSLLSRLTGPGAVALLDPDTRAVQVLELHALSNCTTVVPFPDDDTRALVLCRGDAFGEDETRSGLVEVAIHGGVLVEERRFTPSIDASMPPPSNGLVVLDEARAAYVSSGSVIEGRVDRLVMIDLEEASARVITESAPTPFELGEGALDRDAGVLLVPDGNARAVRVFDEVTLDERDAIVLDGACAPLPPRQVVVLARP